MDPPFCYRFCWGRPQSRCAKRYRAGDYYVEPFDGYRIQFDWYPTSDSTDPVEMRMFLRCQGDAISETWLYQYFPPAPDKRNYVDDRVMK